MSCLSLDYKLSKKEMIAKALSNLPNQRGTKKEIVSTIEKIFNIKLNKKDSSYKTIE